MLTGSTLSSLSSTLHSVLTEEPVDQQWLPAYARHSVVGLPRWQLYRSMASYTPSHEPSLAATFGTWLFFVSHIDGLVIVFPLILQLPSYAFTLPVLLTTV